MQKFNLSGNRSNQSDDDYNRGYEDGVNDANVRNSGNSNSSNKSNGFKNPLKNFSLSNLGGAVSGTLGDASDALYKVGNSAMNFTKVAGPAILKVSGRFLKVFSILPMPARIVLGIILSALTIFILPKIITMAFKFICIIFVIILVIMLIKRLRK